MMNKVVFGLILTLVVLSSLFVCPVSPIFWCMGQESVEFSPAMPEAQEARSLTKRDPSLWQLYSVGPDWLVSFSLVSLSSVWTNWGSVENKQALISKMEGLKGCLNPSFGWVFVKPFGICTDLPTPGRLTNSARPSVSASFLSGAFVSLLVSHSLSVFLSF